MSEACIISGLPLRAGVAESADAPDSKSDLDAQSGSVTLPLGAAFSLVYGFLAVAQV